ncbi:MAG: ATP synthase F1 subunit delta [Planctomycetes bacterium]|nr:ATP synthase F1 subunit delta [Planctomycetota bacterium]
MIERTIARRYATALLNLADESKAVEAVETDIMQIAEIYRANADFRRAVTHPLIPAKDKKEFLRLVLPGLSKLLGEFLDKLVDKGRANCIPEIAEVFDDLADRYAGVVRMTVETAVPMSEAQRAKLLGKLGAIAEGRKVEIEAKVAPELMGGVRVRVRDTVIDGSVAARLKGLRELLTSTMR